MLTENLDKQSLIEILGLENASLEEQTEIIKSATEVVEAQVLDQILDKLNDEETDTFMKLLETKAGNESELTQFLTEKKLDIPAILEAEIAKFKAEMATL